MALRTEVEEKGQVCTITLIGRLDRDTASACDQIVENALSGDTRSLVFNLSELQYISSAGLRTVMNAKKMVEKAGGKVAVANMQPAVENVFSMAHILMNTEIFDSVESADIFLDAMQRRVQMENFDMPDE